jgi:hypothetical protein
MVSKHRKTAQPKFQNYLSMYRMKPEDEGQTNYVEGHKVGPCCNAYMVLSPGAFSYNSPIV